MGYREIRTSLGRKPLRVDLGNPVMTPGAIEALQSNRQSPSGFLVRHAQGDWGELDPGDARANDRALKDGSRLLSSYTLNDGQRIWVITEAVDLDEPGVKANVRETTTILLPEEY